MSWYKKGSWNALCDVCGVRYKADELRKRWDGLMVCRHDFEHDHPQKFLRVPSDKIYVDFVRKEVLPIDNYFCTLWSNSAYADLGEADCMRADNDKPAYTTLLIMKG